MSAIATAPEITHFWFTEIDPKAWFEKNDDFDEILRKRFGATVQQALDGRLADWAETAEGAMALILLLDQFTRNIYRDTPKAFAGDTQALKLCAHCREAGFFANVAPDWRRFILMPMMHSEDIAVQDASLPLFQKYTEEHTYGYAVRHRDIVARFGRFPHRNAILGRESSPEEVTFLAEPNSSF